MMSLPEPNAEFGTRVMCSATGLLIVTLSDGCLQVLLAVTVQTTSVPGMTLPAGTRTLDFSPLSLTTSFSISAVDLRTMHPCVCAKACEPNAQAMRANAPSTFRFALNMCVSFTVVLPRSIDGYGELDRLSPARLSEIAERHAHACSRSADEFTRVVGGRVGKQRAVQTQRARHVSGIRRDVVAEDRVRRAARTDRKSTRLNS